MGIFDGCLICTDLDDTLLTTEKKISDKNMEAIEYFKSEGGLFTFATGRVLQSVNHYIDIINPNAPIIMYNGCAIYDWKNKKFIYKAELDDDAIKIVNFILSSCEFAAIQIVTEDEMYICRENRRMRDHMVIENAGYTYINPEKITKPWIKVLCTQAREEVNKLKELIDNSEYATKFSFTQSSPYYYEILPKAVSKGTATQKLCEFLSIKNKDFYAIGDNENDIEMVMSAGFGAVVQNASDSVKACADAIAPHHNDDAIAWLVNEIKYRRCLY